MRCGVRRARPVQSASQSLAAVFGVGCAFALPVLAAKHLTGAARTPIESIAGRSRFPVLKLAGDSAVTD